MRAALHRAYALATSLPTLPLYEFEAAVAGLGETEVEQMRRVRIGQYLFRDALLCYWDGRCPLTGVGEGKMLRASHILPWADCSSDAEPLDVHNALLLAAHRDAALDAGLVSFSSDGVALFAPALGEAARVVLGLPPLLPLADAIDRSWHGIVSGIGLDEATNDGIRRFKSGLACLFCRAGSV